MSWLDEVKWDANGLVPAIAQEVGSNDVLMFAWMNREALARTAELGEAVYWSRSRGRLWRKGEESGHVQKVHELRLDCDNDVVLLKVEQLGGAGEPAIACHTGRHSCFFQRLRGRRLAGGRAGLERPGAHLQMSAQWTHAAGDDTLARLAARDRVARARGDPATSYVARLLAQGRGRGAEEDRRGGDRGRHGLQGRRRREDRRRGRRPVVPLHDRARPHGLAPADVLAELERREGMSGLEEFAPRKDATSTRSRRNMNDMIEVDPRPAVAEDGRPHQLPAAHDRRGRRGAAGRAGERAAAR